MTNLIAARSIQDIERDQNEMSQKFEKLKDRQLIIRGIDSQIADGDTRTLDSMTSTSFVKQDWEPSCLV